MKRKVFWFKLFVLTFLILPLISGCAIRLGGMTALSTRNVNLKDVDLDKVQQGKNVIGKDSRFAFLGIPLGLPTVQGAVDDALDKGKGDLILDAVIQSEVWTIIIMGENAITVKGNVVNTRGIANDKEVVEDRGVKDEKKS